VLKTHRKIWNHSFGVHMKIRAFSMVETLTVIAIIVLLAAITLSVSFRTRDRAEETSCMTNLKNMYVAIKLYRDDHDGADQGTAQEMGFPSLWDQANIVKPLPRCQAAPSAVFAAKYPYFIMAHDLRLGFSWQEYVGRYGDAAYMLADLNHNPHNVPFTAETAVHRTTAVNLMGSAKTFERKGAWESLGNDFWKP